MNIIVFITAKNMDEATKISRELVNRKLIACANIIKDIKSIFWWEGKVDEADEVLLILKTKRTRYQKLEETVKALHSYKVPEIIALPIIDGNPDYLKWLRDSLR